jgi:multicomponent Na+:H+ antiporter subunit D
MISYILVAEVGYIVMGVSIGNRTAFTGAVLHILNDAFMMACLFLVIGAVVYRTGTRDINDFNGLELNKKMPLSMAAFTIAAISMIGVPPTAGFFSKWYLVLGAINAEKWVFAAALIFSSLVNAILFFRILEKVYFKGSSKAEPSHPGTLESLNPSINEAPASMLVPIYVMAAGILVLGFYSGDIISTVIQYTVPEGF